MLVSLVLFLSTFFSIYHLISSYKFLDKKVLHPVEQKGISILIPCYNEAPILKYTVEGLLHVDYDNLEVIFINDGSQDNTFDTLHQLLDLQVLDSAATFFVPEKVKAVYRSLKSPFIYVVDKPRSGKAGSLNTATRLATKELIVTMDADCVLERDALKCMNKTFDDENVVASSGIVHVMQLFKLDYRPKAIVMMQALDYIKGFYFYKASLAYNDALSIISGAFGVFRKNAIIEVGGFREGLGEDIDITIRFQEYAKNNNKKVVFNRNAICYTECPENLKELTKQRIRWQKGFIDAVLNNCSFLFKNMFRSNVCFYIIVDALLSNSLAVVVFIVNTVLIAAKLLYGYPLQTIVYYLTTVIFNIICSLIAINIARANTPHLKTMPLYFAIFFDIIIFQFLRVFFYLTGAITYNFNNKDWYRVSRTNNSYNL